MNRHSPLLLTVVWLLLAGCSVAGSVERTDERELERAALMQILGLDPVELLTAFANETRAQNRNIYESVSDRDLLRLLRFGLGHDDETVVFGAVRYMPDGLPVPEFDNAARILLPRLGQPDCPVDAGYAKPLIGSGNIAALGPVLGRLEPRGATFFVHELHRMARPDAIDAFCTLAEENGGELQRALMSDAGISVDYDDSGHERFLTARLDIAGAATCPDEPGRLPGLLRAAMRAAPKHGWPDPAARWLYRCTPGPADLPLLREFLAVAEWQNWHNVEPAVWAIGAMSDDASRELLGGPPPPGRSPLVWLAARARRGDDAALDELFAGAAEHVIFALAIANPGRRREYFARLLSRPAAEAAALAHDLGKWPRPYYLEEPFAEPPYDDAFCAGLEPLLATRDDIDPIVLRAFIDALPCCETTRLADRLLDCDAACLFGDVERIWWQSPDLSHAYIAHGGVWAFLEVTRPHRFRQRLLEGMVTGDEDVRELCMELLVRLGDHRACEPLAALVSWLESTNAWMVDWNTLARGADDSVVRLIQRRLAAPELDPDGRDALLAALAVAHGMPIDVAANWGSYGQHDSAVEAALLRGDPAAAYVASRPELPGRSALPALQWQQPQVTSYLQKLRQSPDPADSVESLYQFDQAWTLVHGTTAERERMMQPVVDGRYATHHGFSPAVAAAAWGLEGLPFWIDQLGTNCCKVAFIDEVFEELFGCKSEAFERSNFLEPAAPYLRRTLLPVRDRLRWSRIANGYVVAGR